MSRQIAKVLQIGPEAGAPARSGRPSRTPLLPWEDAAEFNKLLADLVDEHQPEGPTEQHLVEELASIMWRSRRVGLAEAAVYRAGLHDAVTSFRAERTVERALAHVGDKGAANAAAAAVQASPATSAADAQDLDEDQAMTEEALRRLRAGGEGAYEQALAALREDTRDWWVDELEEGESPYAADADSLLRFLEAEVMPHHQKAHREIENRPLIASQAYGEALDPGRLTTLGRYETHLDRKLEKILAMLLKLKELRSSSLPRSVP